MSGWSAASGRSRNARYGPLDFQMRAALITFVLALVFMTSARPEAATAEELFASFRSPPPEAWPHVWWHWMNGNVSAEGAQLDLEWMQRVGVGGVHIFSGALGREPKVVDPPLSFMSAEWRDIFDDAVGTAHDAGMQVGIAGSPGWSQTGGTFVAPQDAMKKYVWSATDIVGGRRFRGALAKPPVATGPFLGLAKPSAAKNLKEDVYADALVVAFPTPPAEQTAPAVFTSIAGPIDLAPLAAGDLSQSISLPIGEGGSAWLQAAYPEPTRLSALTIAIPTGADVEILAGDTPAALRRVSGDRVPADSGVFHPAPQQTLAFAPVTARLFRVVLNALPPAEPLPDLPPVLAQRPPPPDAFTIGGFRLESGARVHRFEAKAGFQTTVKDSARTLPQPADAVVDPARVLNLTDRLQADGRLDWTPPPGRWTVLRFGWTLTGQTNGPAEPEATGLEVDKLDPAAVTRYIDDYLALYADATGGRLGGHGVGTLLTDSWEAGFQNWTPALLDELERRRGYDPVPYTPVLTGRVVESADVSERFLWDFRLTLKELLADAHYRVIADALHARGMTYYTEAAGDNPRVLGDGMSLKARADIPTAEYWYRNFASGPGQLSLKADLEEAASAAHVYGKRLVAAEALTVAAGNDPWSFSPRMMKPVADEIFARGVNRFLLHSSRHQPLIDAKPGMTLAIFGQYFSRNETWADDAAPWMTYLARTSHLLQQGRYVADVAYFYGEDRNLAELFEHRLNTDVPPGYRYDYVNREALLTLLSVRDGRIVTPSGMSYRILYLPRHVTRLTGQALRKIRDLVEAGAVLVGPRPAGGLGLATSDAEIARLADEIWGEDERRIAVRSVGAGRVYPTLEAALGGENIVPDHRLAARDDAELLVLHRRTDETDIYFVSNQKDRAESVRGAFRVTGKAPEIWRAASGTAAPASFETQGDVTVVPLRLEPHEAVFVVFHKPTHAEARAVAARRETPLATLQGPWALNFGPGPAAPSPRTFDELISWHELPDPTVKYFSGSATYRKTVEVERGWLERGRSVLLDLGVVRELAVVTVNGRPIGTAWHAPYRLDVTEALEPGRNELEVRVVNLWPNRLIGDEQPNAEPVTFAPISPYTASSPLLPSGLLGPVRLIGVE